MSTQTSTIVVDVQGTQDLRSLNTSLNTYKKHIGDIISLHQQLSSTTNTLNVNVNGLTKGQATLLVQYAKTTAQTNALIKANTDYIKTLATATQNTNQQTGALQRQLNVLQNLINKQQGQIGTLQQTTAQLKNQVQQLENASSASNKHSVSVANMLTEYLRFRVVHGIIEGVVNLTHKATEAMVEYNLQTARSTRIIGSNNKDYVSQSLRQGTAFSGRSIEDTGEVMYQLGTFINRTDELTTAFNKTLKLLVGTEGDARATTQTIVQIYEQFGETMDSNITSGEKFSRIVDAMAVVFKDAHLEVGELSNALKYLGPIAAETHTPLAQVMGIIGGLSTAGIRGRMGGTGAGQLLAQMVKSYNPAEGGVVKDGLVYKYNLKRIKGGADDGGIDAIGTIKDIMANASRLPTAEAQKYLQVVTGTQNAWRTLGVDSKETGERIDKITKDATEAIDGMSKATDTLHKEMNDTWSTAGLKAWNALLGNTSGLMDEMIRKTGLLKGLQNYASLSEYQDSTNVDDINAGKWLGGSLIANDGSVAGRVSNGDHMRRMAEITRQAIDVLKSRQNTEKNIPPEQWGSYAYENTSINLRNGDNNDLIRGTRGNKANSGTLLPNEVKALQGLFNEKFPQFKDWPMDLYHLKQLQSSILPADIAKYDAEDKSMDTPRGPGGLGGRAGLLDISKMGLKRSPIIAPTKDELERRRKEREREAEKERQAEIRELEGKKAEMDVRAEYYGSFGDQHGLDQITNLQGPYTKIVKRLADLSKDRGMQKRISLGMPLWGDKTERVMDRIRQQASVRGDIISDSALQNGGSWDPTTLASAYQADRMQEGDLRRKKDFAGAERVRRFGRYQNVLRDRKVEQSDFEDNRDEYYYSPTWSAVSETYKKGYAFRHGYIEKSIMDKSAARALRPVEETYQNSNLQAELRRRPNSLYRDQWADEYSQVAEQMSNARTARGSLLASATASGVQNTDVVKKRLKDFDDEIARLGGTLQDLNDRGDVERFTKKLQATADSFDDKRFQLGLGAFQRTGESPEAFRRRQIDQLRAVNQTFMDEKAGLPTMYQGLGPEKQDELNKRMRELQRTIDDNNDHLSDLSSEYSRSKYDEARSSASQLIMSGILNLSHGGNPMNSLNAIGGAINDAHVEAFFKPIMEPLISSLTIQMLSTDANTAATNALTATMGGSVPGNAKPPGGGGGAPGGGGKGGKGNFANTNIGMGLAAYNVLQTGMSAGPVGGAISGIMAGATYGPVGMAVGGAIGLIGGLFGGKKKDPLEDSKNRDPALYNAPSDFLYNAYRYRATGAMPNDLNIKDWRSTAPIVNVYVDGVSRAVQTVVAEQTATGRVAQQNTYFDASRPI